ncbi:MAG TPA: hypothetical protein IGS37_08170 [Synechococcales cyanobacterium M55_K2018_004]|nr:hypothetical protein [Synechococcales cyanobacterium M55_K2018_004]
MISQQHRERIVAIALCALSVFGTLALFGSVPLLAEITNLRQNAPHTGKTDVTSSQHGS